MKMKLQLLLLSIFIFPVICTTNSFANSLTDTTLLAENTVSESSNEMTIYIPSNVIFPSSLESNREQSVAYIKKYSENNKGFLTNMYKQGKKVFPKVNAILKRYGLPEEFRVLIALESGFNGNAFSRAGAVGYWQMMDEVAIEYGLKILSANDKLEGLLKKDERSNFSKSTAAAARYLRDRCKNLNDNVLLIVAAYNWGIGNIRNVMRKTGKSNPTFWDIKKMLPAETRNYVMNFITLNVIFKNFDKFSKNTLVFEPKAVRVAHSEKISTEPAFISQTMTLED